MTLPTPFRKHPPRQPTVEALIRYGAKEFAQAGLAFCHRTGEATHDAASQVFKALDHDHPNPPREYGRPVAAGEVEALALFAARIERRIPAAYLMGRMWFAGLEFEVDERVIVPRSPFAELVQANFEPWLEPSRVRRILDIGTGSGCIAIACAVQFPHARIDAVDISAEALEIAQRNAARHGVAGRLEFHQGDVCEPLGSQRHDLIVEPPRQ
jgi:ribosomal protein L3 glutamine methyltransferase